MKKAVYITNCEGSACSNNNVFELSKFYLPKGDKLFKQINNYLQMSQLSDKCFHYSSADTLRFISPFFRAYGVSNKGIEYFINNIKGIKYLDGAIDAHHFLKIQEIPVFAVSTSFKQFAHQVASTLGVNQKNVYCTKLDFDNYFFSKQEKNKIKDFLYEIVDLPAIKVPTNPNSTYLDKGTQTASGRMENIWKEMKNMECGKLLDVIVMNADRKVKAIKKSIKKSGADVKDVIYVGQDSSDKEALKYVRENGGLAVSFNGNKYVINEAQIVGISNNAGINAMIAELFKNKRLKGVVELFKRQKPYKEIRDYYDFFNIDPETTIVKTKTEKNEPMLVKESEKRRKELTKVFD